MLDSKASSPTLDTCHWRVRFIFPYMTTIDNSFTPVSATKCPLCFAHCVSFWGSTISLLRPPYQNSTAQLVTLLYHSPGGQRTREAWLDFPRGLSPCSVGDCLPAESFSRLFSVQYSSGDSPYSYKVISLIRFQPIHITSFHRNYIFTAWAPKPVTLRVRFSIQKF